MSKSKQNNSDMQTGYKNYPIITKNKINNFILQAINKHMNK
jgi:hypothetical protein